MLKITTVDDGRGVTVHMEGQLAGSWVRELVVTGNAATACLAEEPMRVDLTAADHIDSMSRAFQC